MMALGFDEVAARGALEGVGAQAADHDHEPPRAEPMRHLMPESLYFYPLLTYKKAGKVVK